MTVIAILSLPLMMCRLDQINDLLQINNRNQVSKGKTDLQNSSAQGNFCNLGENREISLPWTRMVMQLWTASLSGYHARMAICETSWSVRKLGNEKMHIVQSRLAVGSPFCAPALNCTPACFPYRPRRSPRKVLNVVLFAGFYLFIRVGFCCVFVCS